jgi:hypothetical protein
MSACLRGYSCTAHPVRCPGRRPFCPKKQTLVGALSMSAKCHKQTCSPIPQRVVPYVSPLLRLNQRVYWNILWGLYNSSAASAEA